MECIFHSSYVMKEEEKQAVKEGIGKMGAAL